MVTWVDIEIAAVVDIIGLLDVRSVGSLDMTTELGGVRGDTTKRRITWLRQACSMAAWNSEPASTGRALTRKGMRRSRALRKVVVAAEVQLTLWPESLAGRSMDAEAGA